MNLMLKGYVVAYLDIAGQSDKLQQLRKGQWWTLDDQTLRLLRATYGSVKRFREIHEQFQRGSSAETPLAQQFLASNPTEAQRRAWDATKQGEKQIRHQYLADSIVTYVPVTVIDGVFPFEAIFTVMVQCCHSILASLSERRTIRAGLAVGPCVHDPESDEVYGAALSEAVALERRAGWFRILVDDEIVRLAIHAARCVPVTPAENATVAFARACLSLVTKDVDGLWILDYLGVGIRQVYDIPQTLEHAAAEHISRQLAETKGLADVHEKYRKVHDYFAKNGSL